MSYSQPLFHGGMYGKANAVVCNGWQQAANATNRFGEAMRWADDAMARGQVVTSALCEITAAALMGGNVNRWTYSVQLWTPPPPLGAGIAVPTDARFTYTTCRNLREEYNDSAYVDGMSTSSPIISIGPVGSEWNGTVWTTTNLKAKVMVYVVYNSAGNPYPFFDRPNPLRCS